MTGWLKARILTPLPDSVYEDVVYTQTAVLEMPDGKVLFAFDPDMLCESHMVGSVREVVLDLFLSDVERLDEPAFGITPNDQYDNWRGHTFYGRIEKYIKDRGILWLNTGYGFVLVDAHRTSGDPCAGDFVKSVTGRLDLKIVAGDDGIVASDPLKIF